MRRVFKDIRKHAWIVSTDRSVSEVKNEVIMPTFEDVIFSDRPVSEVTKKNSLLWYWAGMCGSPQFTSSFLLLIRVSALEAVWGSGITGTSILNLASGSCLGLAVSRRCAVVQAKADEDRFHISMLQFLVFSLMQA